MASRASGSHVEASWEFVAAPAGARWARLVAKLVVFGARWYRVLFKLHRIRRVQRIWSALGTFLNERVPEPLRKRLSAIKPP